MLDWVVTVGEKASTSLAPAARQQGCQVKECRDAIEAGAFVREKLQPGGVALLKGSSGGVWLEEAIKVNLSSTSDEAQLVRQEPYWLQRKQAFFTANRLGGEKLDTYNSRYRNRS
jgi:UDP-N-acetylmuramoyl-tripeptide--D-alanyl-D-alanine ligase